MRYRSLMASAFVATLLFLFATSVYAQTPVTPTPTTKVGWDANPAAEGVTAYTLYSDNVAVASQIPVVANPTTPFPALTPGAHVLEVTATNGVGASARSAALNVLVIVTVPRAPTGLRIITARWTPKGGWVPVLEFI